MLTNSELNQIKNFLALYGKKDSQLSLVTSVKNNDYVAIVQGSKNVTITIELLKKAVLEGLVNDEVFDILIDSVPTKDSRKLVRSNGIWHAINDAKVIKESQIDDGAVSTRTIIDGNVTYNKLSNDVTSAVSKYSHTISLPSGTDTLREIGEESLEATFNTTHKIVFFGDKSSEDVIPSESSTTSNVDSDTVSSATNEWGISPTVGTHTLTHTSKYGGIRPNNVSVSINLNLRKYFGYVPDNVISQGSTAILNYLIQNKNTVTTSDFSNTVGCTINIPTNGEGKKYAYFAVPKPMVISSVIQTASQLIFPLDTPVDVTRTITVESVDNYFPYRLYKSTEKPDSDRSKQVKIS